MAVDKKYIKVGVAGLAVAALVIGLSVGLTQSNKNKTNASAAMANGGENVASDFDEEMIAYCSPSSSAKSGKSGGESGGGKSGKSGRNDEEVRRGRRLVVPGTEDYHAEQQQQLEAGDNKSVRRALIKKDLVRELQGGVTTYVPTYSPTASGKSGKSGSESAGSGKSGKSGNSNSVTSDDTIVCRKPKDICGEPQYSFTSDDSSSSAGKSGKSGGDGDGKSGKSGGDMSMMGSGKSGKSGGESGGSGKSGKSGYGSYDYGSSCGKAGKSGSGGKSGKSGGGKSGKSGGSGDNSFSYGSSGSNSGKAGKSGTYDSEDCPSIAPTVCEPTETYMPTDFPTDMPTECICEEQAWYIDVMSLKCVRGCDINCDTLPAYPESGGAETCRERGFSSNSNCIEDCTREFARGGQECTTDDSICTPEAPTNMPTTSVPTDMPTECVCEDQNWYINVEEGTCTRGCDINCDMLPPYPESGGGETCRERGFSSNNNCIEACTELFAMNMNGRWGCTTDDSICSPVETTPRPTPSPTSGSTPTVSAEQTGPPTKSAPLA